ncbi:ABC transporter permease [Bacteriovorax sp. DB6_IX]|uniref:ABC transporter permease n=1 Tax=Bacteriovorax sp. DB6_IX TaxID=1353530 RepID=UPI00038A55EE|nr:ABC transporter permease [Bacteriovorax sp. DB6_IX]EQC49985.1 MacB-like periplasmic core domain protein [Bacteriovorax sp. DB6_IX]
MNFLALFKDFNLLFFRDKSSRLFVLATILGLSFSLSIILSTLGLMDGFTKKLRESLNLGHGEIVLTSQKGFFSPHSSDFEGLDQVGIDKISFLVRTQSFAIHNTKGKAVFVLGVDSSFADINKSFTPPASGEVVIGSSLAENLGLKVGEDISLSFAAGRSGDKYLPSNASLKIREIINFNMHKFNDRFVYANRSDVQRFIGVEGLANVANLKVKEDMTSYWKIVDVVDNLRSIFVYEYNVMPYWAEFKSFIDAVEYEKTMISIVLSVVVVIAIFNCLAFIVYSKQKKSKEIFLLFSIGLSPRKFRKLWLLQNFFIWFVSIIVALGFVQLFNYALGNWDIFALPKDVYHLGRIEVHLSMIDLFVVTFLSFLVIQFLTWLVLRLFVSKSLASGLREEFS